MIKIKEAKKTLFCVISLSLTLLPAAALALGTIAPPANVPDSLDTAIGNIVTGVVAILAMVSVLLLVIGGVQYATSAGDEGAVEKAKNTMTYAIVGLFIAALAYAVVSVIVGWL